MNQWILIITYISIGLAGGYFHYLKKFYVDNTCTQTFKNYLTVDKRSTFYAISALISAEYTLAMSDLTPDFPLTVQEFIGALTAGYVADSSINKTGEPTPN